MTRASTPNPLPRELAPGLFWLGECLPVPFEDRVLHGYNSVFLVAGEDRSVLVEAGLTSDIPSIQRQIRGLLRRGVPDIEYLFITHNEIPHAGGIGRLHEQFPNAVVCGDVTDLHLVFPELADRVLPLDPGDSLDLGGTRLEVTEAVFRDLVTTRWAFDTRRKALFAGDGFSYSHYHEDGHCGRIAEEAESLDVADQVALFAMAAFYWTQFVSIEPYIDRLDELLFDKFDVQLIAPTHGLPIANPRATLPEIRRGLRLGSQMETDATLLERMQGG